MTNAERFRSMSIDELANAINVPCSCCAFAARDSSGNVKLYEKDCINNCCYDGIKQWLESDSVSLKKEDKFQPSPEIETTFSPSS